MEKLDCSLQKCYKKVASIPEILEACLIPIPEQSNFIVHYVAKNYDFDSMKSRRFRVSIFGSKSDKKVEVIASIVNDCNFMDRATYNRSEMQQVILRNKEVNGKLEQYIEVWNRDKPIHSFNTSDFKCHGKIYSRSEFACFNLNETGDKLLYTAEKDFHEPVSKNEVDSFQEDWGEKHVGQCKSVICCLDIQNGETSVITPSDDLMFGQGIWIDNSRIAFVGWDIDPVIHGIYACNNRRSALYIVETASNSIDIISSDTESVRSPRCSPNSKMLVYLQNSARGSHKKCSQLMQFNVEEGTTKTLVEIVHSASGEEFPGIYTDSLPLYCWTKDSQFVIFSSIWRSDEAIIAVNTNNGNLKRLTTPFCKGSFKALDVLDDTIIAQVSAINIEPFLVFGRIKIFNDELYASWYKLDPLAPKALPISWTVCDMNVSQRFEFILVRPENVRLAKQALIVWPHGGPHSTYTTEFRVLLTCFVLQGFSVCLVNYRGSLGFGEDNLQSVIGKIGVQDISDVHLSSGIAKSQLSQDFPDSEIEVFLYGGSHGGFVVTHMCAKHPADYRACVCVNPVTNLVGMIEGTDIPDWIWEESGLGFHDKKNLYCKGYPLELWQSSPLFSAEKVDTPTLILLGKNDRRVPPSQGLTYYRVLKSRRVPVKLFMYDDGHALDSSVAETFYESTKFFLQHSISSTKGYSSVEVESE